MWSTWGNSSLSGLQAPSGRWGIFVKVNAAVRSISKIEITKWSCHVNEKKRTKSSSNTPIAKARQVKREGYGEKKSPIFGQNVLQRRLALNMTQEELAKAIGASRPRITDIENGRFPTDPDRINAIARALGTDPNTLLGFILGE